MSFGFGVGDFIAVIKLLNDVRKRFEDIPQQVDDLAAEVQRLSYAAVDAETLDTNDLAPYEQTRLADLKTDNQKLRDELKIFCSRFDGPTSDQKRITSKLRRVWETLKLDPADIAYLHNRIRCHIDFLHQFGQSLTQKDVSKILRYHTDEESQKVIDWISPENYSLQQNDLLRRRQPGTRKWLLESSEFHDWLTARGSTLVCQGIPGAGKTITTSMVVEHLENKFSCHPSVGVAYIYCNFRRNDQTPHRLMSSLLRSLVERLPVIPQDIINVYEDARKKKRDFPDDQIAPLLRTVAAKSSSTFVIVDALDELSRASRVAFIRALLTLQDETATNLFLTSRNYPHILEALGKAIQIEVKATPEEVRLYLNNHRHEFPTIARKNPEIQDRIKDTIVQAVNGMFLLAELHLISLQSCVTSKKLNQALARLPTGSNTYDEAYKQIMERITSQEVGFRDLAVLSLTLITTAKRPLKLEELRYALATDPDGDGFCVEDMPEVEDIIASCLGLLTVDPESQVIRLVHYTTQEYLDRTQDDWLPNAEETIGRTCVAYLLTEAICKEIRTCQNPGNMPFYWYASEYWAQHLGPEADTPDVRRLLRSDIVSFLLDPKQKQNPFFLDYRRRVGVPLREGTGLHLAAVHGLTTATSSLIASSRDIEPLDAKARTPLVLACKHGHSSVVQIYLENKSIKKPSYLSWGAALAMAVGNEHKKCVEILLSDSRICLQRRTTKLLVIAAKQAKNDILQLLLSGTTFVGVQDRTNPLSSFVDEEDWTNPLSSFVDEEDRTNPLSSAVSYGRIENVKLLLEKGFGAGLSELGKVELFREVTNCFQDDILREIISKADFGFERPWEEPVAGARYALFAAILRCNAMVVKLLLPRVDANAQERSGSSALHACFEHTGSLGRDEDGRRTILHLLLDNPTVAVDVPDARGVTPLMKAAELGDTVLLEILFGHCNVFQTSSMCLGNRGKQHTPMAGSCGCRHCKVDSRESGSAAGSALIIDSGLTHRYIDVNARDRKGTTALFCAAKRGDFDMVERLVTAYGACTCNIDDEGKDIFMIAASKGYPGMMGFLLEHMDVDGLRQDCYGATSLEHSMRSGNMDAVRILLQHTAIPLDYRLTDGSTLLHDAARFLSNDVATLDRKEKPITMLDQLVNEAKETGVPLDLQDLKGRTPFHLVILSLQKGPVNFNSPGYGRDDGGMEMQCKQVWKLLEEPAVNPSITDYAGRNAISMAVLAKRPRMVELLLGDPRIEPDQPDHDGITPLAHAVEVNIRTATALSQRSVDVLLNDVRVNPMKPDATGQTPLSRIRGWMFERVIIRGFLACPRVRPDIPGPDGRTLFSRVASMSQRQGRLLRNMLARKDIDPNKPDQTGRTPLSWAAELNDADHHGNGVRKLLDDARIDPDTPDEIGRSPLSYAAERGHLVTVHALLTSENVDPLAADAEGRTAMDWARRALEHLVARPEWNAESECPYNVPGQSTRFKIPKCGELFWDYYRAPGLAAMHHSPERIPFYTSDEEQDKELQVDSFPEGRPVWKDDFGIFDAHDICWKRHNLIRMEPRKRARISDFLEAERYTRLQVVTALEEAIAARAATRGGQAQL
ncbi:ankyrin repeat-containing domain protein [Xylariomycetidae sp. FL0641]|nr:ankyrin repeat-containing domain protein [Xylariomycetidae sp. FL0641]